MARSFHALLLLAVATYASPTWAHPPQSPEAVAAKFRRAASFAEVRTELMNKQRAELENPALDRRTAVAAIATIMNETNMRVGSEKYAEREAREVHLASGRVIHQEPSFGASSLRKDQVTVDGDEVHFTFRGKCHVTWDRHVTDPLLARTVNLFKSQPGDRLFQIPHGGGLSPVTERDVHRLFASVGAEAKDLRTVQANELLDKTLAGMPHPTTKAQAEAQLTEAIKHVAHQMGHTPNVCRSNYLNPATLDAYLERAR